MEYDSRSIVGGQSELHENLLDIVDKHRQHVFQKPIAQHSQQAFDQAHSIVVQQQKSVILDSGCGVGHSTLNLAHQNPDCLVIGVDRSDARLSKANTHQSLFENVDNYCFVRADLLDFWRLVVDAKWNVVKHTIFYPNPYPKKKHIMRRFYASPIFPVLLKIGGELEVRSNWKMYIDEFVEVLNHVNVGTSAKPLSIENEQYMTMFEKKYALSDQALWFLQAQL